MESSPATEPENIKAKIKETYDNIATQYNTWTELNQETRSLFFDKFITHLSRSASENIAILELGCGGGVPFTKALLSIPSTTVFANDISSAQISIAKQNLSEFGDRVTFKEGDMMQLEFPEGSLDAVVGLYTIIHLPREEQAQMVTRIAKWLKPGGCMLVNFTSNADEVIIEPDWLVDKGWMFWSGWGKEQSLDIVKRAGFEILQSEIKGDPGDSVFLWILASKLG